MKSIYAILVELACAAIASAHGVPVLRSQACYSQPAVYSQPVCVQPVVREAVSYEVVQPPPQLVYPPAQIIERRQQVIEYQEVQPVYRAQAYSSCASNFTYRQSARNQFNSYSAQQFNAYGTAAFQGGTNVNVNVERRGLLGGLLGGRRQEVNVNTNGAANVNVKTRR